MNLAFNVIIKLYEKQGTQEWNKVKTGKLKNN